MATLCFIYSSTLLCLQLFHEGVKVIEGPQEPSAAAAIFKEAARMHFVVQRLPSASLRLVTTECIGKVAGLLICLLHHTEEAALLSSFSLKLAV